MIKLILIGCLLLASMVARAQDASMEESLKQMQAVSDKCKELYVGQMDLSVLTGKIPVEEFDPITSNMLSLNRKPNTIEKKALGKLMTIRGSCDLLWEEVLPGASTNAASLASIAALGSLRDGKMSFSEYVSNLEIKRRKGKENLDALAREHREVERKRSEELNRVLSLSCIVDSHGQLNGIEFQYAINEARQTVFASRGPEAPSNIVIGPTEISFNQKDSRVSISRNTGRFDISSPKVGALASGRCQVITERRF